MTQVFSNKFEIGNLFLSTLRQFVNFSIMMLVEKKNTSTDEWSESYYAPAHMIKGYQGSCRQNRRPRHVPAHNMTRCMGCLGAMLLGAVKIQKHPAIY
jgi:hypothetical protein